MGKPRHGRTRDMEGQHNGAKSFNDSDAYLPHKKLNFQVARRRSSTRDIPWGAAHVLALYHLPVLPSPCLTLSTAPMALPSRTLPPSATSAPGEKTLA